MGFISSLETVFLIALLLGAGLLVLYLMQGHINNQSADDMKVNKRSKKSSNEEVDKEDTENEVSENDDSSDNNTGESDNSSNESESDHIIIESIVDITKFLGGKSIDFVKTICILFAVLLFAFLMLQIILAMGAPDKLQQTGMSIFK